MQCQATCHPRWPKAGAESSLFRTALPSTSSTSDTHSLGSPLTEEGRVFPMQISSQVGETRAPPFPGRGAVAAVGRGWEGCTPLPWAMRWSLSAWPLCRCHSDSCGSIGAWRCCREGRAHHLTGQGQGTSSSWWGCRERGMRSQRKDALYLPHQKPLVLRRPPKPCHKLRSRRLS